MKTSKAVLGILAGIAAGVIAGALLVPGKNSRNKKKIRKTGGDLAQALSERIDQRFDILVEGINEKLKLNAVSQREHAMSNRDTILD